MIFLGNYFFQNAETLRQINRLRHGIRRLARFVRTEWCRLAKVNGSIGLQNQFLNGDIEHIAFIGQFFLADERCAHSKRFTVFV